ncbi:alpha/beta hydrolase [Verrucomicrobiales bacterium]|nr:alpha/beta hydrolase [Verrucomicrobiales bacterium]
MKLLLCALSFSTVLNTASAAPFEPINLWPGGVPGEAKPLAEPESVELKGEHQIEIMSNVSIPQLTMYPAKKPNGTAVIVCPGGGYNILAYSHEGKEVCDWLNTLGITAGLLKYRVPRRDQLEKHHAPLQDAQRAIGMMRARADEWKIRTDKIGVLGFSAGGHLASMALTSDGKRNYKPDSKFDSGSCIPDFAVLVYAAYQLDEKNPDKLSAEIKVTDKTPPAFLVVAHGDKKWAEGSARFYIEMKRADRDCELHIFGKGGHGFGFKNTDEEIKQWPKLAEKWMLAMGIAE